MNHRRLADTVMGTETSNGISYENIVVCASFTLCLSPFSATCLPTSQSGGTASPSWPLHSSVFPTCICTNWGTSGRSSFTWRWAPSWPCRSDWGNRWAKHRTTMSDKKRSETRRMNGPVVWKYWKQNRDKKQKKHLDPVRKAKSDLAAAR